MPDRMTFELDYTISKLLLFSCTMIKLHKCIFLHRTTQTINHLTRITPSSQSISHTQFNHPSSNTIMSLIILLIRLFFFSSSSIHYNITRMLRISTNDKVLRTMSTLGTELPNGSRMVVSYM